MQTKHGGWWSQCRGMGGWVMMAAEGANLSGFPIGRFFTNLFTSLQEAGVAYAVMRNYEGLPEQLGHDVDLLVADLIGFEKLAKRAARAAGWQLVRKLEKFSFLSLFFSRRQDQQLYAVQLDAWSPFTWKGLEIVSTETLRERNLYRNLFYILPPGAEGALSLISHLIYHGKVKEKYKARIPGLVRSDPEAFAAALGPCLSRTLTKTLADLAGQGRWPEIEALAPHLRRQALWRGLRRQPLGQIGQILAFAWGHARNLWRPSGLFLVLIGPDGSGKSTISGKLRPLLQPLFTDTRYYHGHFMILPRLRDLGRLAGFNLATEDEEAPSGQPASKRADFGLWRSLLYLCYYGLDYILGYPAIFRARGKGELVIFDRYFYDYLIQARLSAPPWLIILVMRLIPTPDVIIYLKNDPAVIFSRKPELTPGELERQGSVCAKIISILSNGRVVETTESPEETTLRVAQLLIDDLTRSTETLRKMGT